MAGRDRQGALGELRPGVAHKTAQPGEARLTMAELSDDMLVEFVLGLRDDRDIQEAVKGVA
jgi:hypothetical protein